MFIAGSALKKIFFITFTNPDSTILMVKLAPTYYRKLDLVFVDIGWFRELPAWRKDFKAAWKKAKKTAITLPLNEKYHPDPHQWVCTCPQFVVDRFLICKHLVQSCQFGRIALSSLYLVI